MKKIVRNIKALPQVLSLVPLYLSLSYIEIKYEVGVIIKEVLGY